MIASRRCFFKPFVEETKLKKKLEQLDKELAATKDPREKAAIEELIQLNRKELDIVVNKLFRR